MAQRVLGVLGGGQLGWMLALAATRLGVRVRTLDESADVPSARDAEHVVGRFSDERAVESFAAGCDVVTCEFENVPASALEAAARRVPVLPRPRSFAVAQDRASERALFESLGIATPAWARIDRVEDVEIALRTTGLPAIFKTRRMGYDGKGQRIVRTHEEAIIAASDLLRAAPGGLIADQMIPFSAEVSVIAARAQSGETAIYSLAENVHRRGILWRTIAPALLLHSTPEIDVIAREAARRVLEALDHIGVLAVEFFVSSSPDGRPLLLANEIAPRVHNTGHWTIEGARTSQFENHVRAVMGMPLGSSEMAHSVAAMVNLVGTLPPSDRLSAISHAGVHLYGKEPRPGRKLGHVTICDDAFDRLRPRLSELESLIAWSA